MMLGHSSAERAEARSSQGPERGNRGLPVFPPAAGFFSRRNFARVFHAVSLSSFQRGRSELMPPSLKRLSRDPDHVVSGRINWRAVKRRLFLVAPKLVGFRVIAFRFTAAS